MISTVIILGILIITNGHSAYRQDSNEESQFDGKLFENILKLSSNDGFLNHPEEHREKNQENIINKITHNNAKKLTNSEKDNSVLEMLTDLGKTLKLNGNEEMRCYGDGCGESRLDNNRINDRDNSGNKDYKNQINHRNHERHLPCNGKSCRVDRNNDRMNRNSIQCYGKKCKRITYNSDYNGVKNKRIFKDITRSPKNYNDDNNIDDVDFFRCYGDRCSRNKNYNKARGTLNCVGERCVRNREHDRNYDYNDRDEGYADRDDSYARNNEYDSKNDLHDVRNGLRCFWDRCDRHKDGDEGEDLFCIRFRCSRDRNKYIGRDTLPCMKNKCGSRKWLEPKYYNVSRTVRRDIDTFLQKFAQTKKEIERKNAENDLNRFNSFLRHTRDQMLYLLHFNYGRKNEKTNNWAQFWNS